MMNTETLFKSPESFSDVPNLEAVEPSYPSTITPG